MLDYLPGGTVGGMYGEGFQGVTRTGAAGDGSAEHWRKYWKEGDWNHIRTRIVSAVPRIQVWMNGHQIVDWTDTENHLPGGSTEGMIAVQVHRSDPQRAENSRWKQGGYHRFRNIAIKELAK
jgi:hypothetical protein